MTLSPLENKKIALLEEVLNQAAFDGWNDKTLEQAAEKIGENKNYAYVCFPNGINELIAFYGEQCDAKLEEKLNSTDLESLKIRERIAKSVTLRLEIYDTHKEAVRQLMAHYALPFNAPTATKNIWKTVDIMWKAAGDTSTDFNYYTKRTLLYGVYTSTVLYWTRDNSNDMEKTQEFLNRRIDNVMQINKLKATCKQPDLGKLHEFNPFNILKKKAS